MKSTIFIALVILAISFELINGQAGQRPKGTGQTGGNCQGCSHGIEADDQGNPSFLTRRESLAYQAGVAFGVTDPEAAQAAVRKIRESFHELPEGEANGAATNNN